MVKKRGVGAAALADGDLDIQVSHRFEKPRDSERSAVQRSESTTADESMTSASRAAGSIRAISSPAELLSLGERGDQSAFSGFVLSMTIFPVRASARLGKTPAHAV
jgi:hypothetical protein